MKAILKKAFNGLVSDRLKLSLSRKLQGQLPDELNDKTMYYYLRNLRNIGYKPDVVVDVGAYQGEWTSKVKKIFPEARFIMVEAQKGKEPFLQKVQAGNRDVSYEIAMLGKELKPQVAFYEMETGSSVYAEVSPIERTVTHYDMKTLDGILSKYELSGECFLKMDVQGSERDVLDGGIESLKKFSFVLMETSVLEYNQGAPLASEMVKYMLERDFVIHDILEQRRTPGDEVLINLDILFSREDSSLRKLFHFNRTKDIKPE